MAQNDLFVHLSYIIERQKKFPDDIKERFKVMKDTAKNFDDSIIHDVLPKSRKLPLEFTGTSISIDETNLNMYKVDVRLKINKKIGMTQEKLLDLGSQWATQLKKSRENRRVICHSSLRLGDGRYQEIKEK